MTLSPDQHTDRASGLSATDFSAILGLHPFRSPLDVWLEKTGKAAAFAGNERTKWGELLEPTIRDDYAARHGYTVEQCGTLHVSVAGVSVYATPDGIVHPARSISSRGLEIKTHSVYAADYGPDGSDEVPAHIAVQCQIGAHVAGVERWDLVAFYDNQPHDFYLAYDGATAEAAIGFGVRWWRDHVVAHKPPEPDGSKATEAALGRMWRGTWRELKSANWLMPTPAQLDTIQLLRFARTAEKMAALNTATARQRLELDIGAADGFEFVDGAKKERVSWRKSKSSTAVDYQAVLQEYQARSALAASVSDVDALLDEVRRGPDVARYTAVTPGVRRFTVPRSWSKDAPGDDGGDDG